MNIEERMRELLAEIDQQEQTAERELEGWNRQLWKLSQEEFLEEIGRQWDNPPSWAEAVS